MGTVYLPREVEAIINHRLSRPGDHAHNLITDCELMLRFRYGLDEGDARSLDYILRHATRATPEAPFGAAVTMSAPQWAAFVSARQRYLRARERKFSSLRYHPTRSALAQLQSIR